MFCNFLSFFIIFLSVLWLALGDLLLVLHNKYSNKVCNPWLFIHNDCHFISQQPQFLFFPSFWFFFRWLFSWMNERERNGQARFYLSVTDDFLWSLKRRRVHSKWTVSLSPSAAAAAGCTRTAKEWNKGKEEFYSWQGKIKTYLE